MLIIYTCVTPDNINVHTSYWLFSSGMFFGSTMVMVTIALVMAVIVTNIFAKKDSNTHAPRWIVKFSAYFYPMYLPERPDLTTYQEQTQHHVHTKHDCYNNSRPGDIMSVSDGEIESLSDCSCCRQLCRRAINITDRLEMDRIDIEWRVVARFSDRCFFWLFVIISTCVFTILFMKMVPPEPAKPAPGSS
jgi:hypothetical protein